MTDNADSRPVIDLAALERTLPLLSSVRPPLTAHLVAGGHSNLTYRIDDASDQSFALRRPPLGRVHSRAHDVAREYRILKALGPTNVPVPPVECLVQDMDVIGAPFYLMRWVDGAVIDTPEHAERALPSIELRHQATRALSDTLATLHALDVDQIGLGDLGSHENYLQRQIERLRASWERTKTRELPIVDDLAVALSANPPPQRHTGLVHSDYRFGNTIIDARGAVAAVLDWELCAIGDVLVDIGLLVNNWDEPEDPSPGVWMKEPPTRLAGFPSRTQIIERYAQKTGFDLDDLDYYRAFGYWKICIIGEGMKRRYQTGAMAEGQVDIDEVERRIHDRAALAQHFFNRWRS